MNKELFPEYPLLVVDDDKDYLSSINFVLSSNGITNVECCQDSRDVMCRLKKKKYSVILLDLQMPVIRGDVLLPQITDKYPELPIIVNTSSSESEIVDECMKNGAFDCLIKPFETKYLIRTIQDALDLKEVKE